LSGRNIRWRSPGLFLTNKNSSSYANIPNLRIYSWGLPGGDLKFGEDPVEAIRREVREETGLLVQEVELLFAVNSTEIRQVNLVYLCKGVSGLFISNEEVSQYRYFDLNTLPDFRPIHGRVVYRALAFLGLESGPHSGRSE
jgi:8-oxo-dGTP pyrophosphatase MutT (NUDIX family)